MLTTVFGQVLMIYIQIGLGALLVYTKILYVNASKTLASLVVNVTMPFMCFCSMAQNLNMGNIKAAGTFLLVMVVLSFSLHFVGELYCRIMKIDSKEKGVHRFTFAQANTASFGIPILNAIWGNATSIYIGLINLSSILYTNTLGLYSIGSDKEKMSIKQFVLTPMFIGCFLGAVLGLLQIPIPNLFISAMTNIGNMTTPLAMIYIGTLMTTMDFKKAFKNIKVVLTSIFRLIIIPISVYYILKTIFYDNYYLYTVSTLMHAMPAFVILPVFAAEYHGDVETAASLTAITSFCSLLTIPIIINLIY